MSQDATANSLSETPLGGAGGLPMGRPAHGADEPFRTLMDQIGEGAVTLTADGVMAYGNERLASMLRLTRDQVVGQRLEAFLHPKDMPAFAAMRDTAQHGGSRREFTLNLGDGHQVPVYISLNVLRSDGAATWLCGIVTDLTERRQHLADMRAAKLRLQQEAADRTRLEHVLRQSQKMAAVGQLASGLAHDFNNVLTALAGRLELLEIDLEQGRFGELADHLAAALHATGRAAALADRLLAFSRPHARAAVLVDMNRLVAELADLLQRTMGGLVAVDVTPAAGLWLTRVDPHQLESALLNLCINARDAMPRGGRLGIATANLELDQPSAAAAGVAAGRYVALSVTDDGTGMSMEVAGQAFETFFTTKAEGAGTGLGLSMIAGFALQSGGAARIASVEGAGTTVTIWLPCCGDGDTGDEFESRTMLGASPERPLVEEP